MKALFLVATGFEDIEYTAPRDILVRAGVEVVTADCRIVRGPLPVRGGRGIEVLDLVPLSDIDIEGFDLLVVPGGGHAKGLESNPEVLRAIRFFAEDPKRYLAAICAAPTILGRMGLLRGRRYTCFPSMNEDFGGTFIQTYSVVDDHLITGDGPAASIQFGLAIVRTILGSEQCLRVGSALYFEGIEEFAVSHG